MVIGSRSIAIVLGMGLLGVLAGCAPKPLILKGPRFDLRTPLDTVRAEAAKGQGDLTETRPPNRAASVVLSPPVVNADWSQGNGGPRHHMRQPALGAALNPLWSAPIGRGNDKRHTITATPVVAGGRVYTLDSRAGVTATGTDGRVLWRQDVTPPGEQAKDASGGGLAYGDGKLFVTSDFGELVALDPASGHILWRQRLPAPAAGAPAVEGGTVYVMAANSTAWAVNAADGKVRWQLASTSGEGGLTGGAAPALSGRFAVLPFASGMLIGVLKPGGTQIWTTPVVGARPGEGYAALTDFSADPVILGQRVFVGNSTGQVMSLDLNTGNKVWSVREGALGNLWVAGNAVFFVSDHNRLVRLDAATGTPVWSVPLPYYKPVRNPRNRRDIFVQYGPIIAGGRLIVASSDGTLRSFDPVSGKALGIVSLGADAATAPVVAGRTLYVVTSDGRLRAFR